MKIAIVVHGRFVAFDMAQELLRRGHDVTLFTNYPRWAVKRFGFPGKRVHSFWLQGVCARIAGRLPLPASAWSAEPRLHRMFGAWAAREVASREWDVVQCWSGVAEETLRALEGRRVIRQVVRGSAHIRTQAALLRQEAERTRMAQQQPSGWMIAREEREYALADQVVVLSSFAFDSFVRQGIPARKLTLVRPGAPLTRFRPTPLVARERYERILAGQPLRVLMVGTISFRKGMWDMAAAVSALHAEPFAFRFVGPVRSEARALVKEIGRKAEFLPKQPEAALTAAYSWADVFVLPTVEDGFPAVLSQAAASGLPILTTPNGAGVDLVRDGQNGWLVPIRSPQLLIDHLRWCQTHRQDVATMTQSIYNSFRPHEWTDAIVDFERACAAAGKPSLAAV